MRLRSSERRGRAAVPLSPLVCRWDLDKTYLRSEFTTIRQLLRTAFERPEQKIDVPGVAELIRALKAAAAAHGQTALVYFVSASPPQIGKAIRAKLALDGVPYDGIVFKDQLEQLRRGRFRNLREHVGFKLVELLRGRLAAAPETRELCFGDDWESDSLIYSLYADILAGRLTPAALMTILGRIRVDPLLVSQVIALATQVSPRDVVERIFINLERRTPPATFRLFGPRVVPTFNYFQTATVLAVMGRLRLEDVGRVGIVLVERSGYTARRLENSLDDLVRRGLLSLQAAERLAAPLRATGLLNPLPSAPSWWRRARVRLGRWRRPGRRETRPAVEPAALDYEAILARVQPAARRAAASGGTP
jgi:hypothetical protein